MSNIVPVDPGAFQVDTSKPPYEVPCPICNAWALDSCHSKPRDRHRAGWPPDARILQFPHPERQAHWEANPLIRVKAIL